jgi:predicted porin
MKRSLVVLAVVSLVFAGVASAEVKKGDIQLDFLAGWTQQNLSGDIGGGHATVFFGAVRPGIALTDNIRVAGVGAVAYEDTTNVGHVTVWTLGVGGEYVFMPASQLNPYVGAEIAYANADAGGGFSLDGCLFAPRAGVLFTLNRSNNLFAEYQYQMYTGDLDKIVNNGHMVLLGIEHKFKVGQ